MGIYENMPYTNLQNINIDWLLKATRDSKEKIDNVYANMNTLIDAEVMKVIDEKITDDGLKEYINQYLSTFTADAYSALMKSGFFPSDVTIIEVGIDKTFKNLTSAIASLSANQPTIIYLHEGVYNTFDEKSVGTLGIMIPNNCYVIGAGNRSNIILSAVLEGSTDPYYSPINLTENCGVYNFTITAKNVRYCIHDDFDNSFVFGSGKPSTTVRHVNSIVLIGNTLAMQWSYGAGIRPGAKLYIENSTFISEGGSGNIPFSMHNMTGDKSPCYIYFKGCQFYSQTRPIDCRFTNVTNYNNFSNYGQTYVTFEQCPNVKVLFDNETPAGSGENTFYIKSDNNVIADTSDTQGAGWGFIQAPNIEKLYPYNEDMKQGDCVFNDTLNRVAVEKIGVADQRAALISGVSAENAQSKTSVVTIFKNGISKPSWLGYSFSEKNVFLRLDTDARLKTSASKTDDTVGFLNNYGWMEIWKKI